MNAIIHVLMVDDDPNDVWLVREAVRRDGVKAEIHALRDGQELLQYLSADSPFDDRSKHPLPDLLLMDLKMPRVTGLEVLQWLKEHEECSAIPTVMFSASGIERDINEAYRRGVNTYFEKPADFKKFAALIRLILSYWAESKLPALPVHC